MNRKRLASSLAVLMSVVLCGPMASWARLPLVAYRSVPVRTPTPPFLSAAEQPPEAARNPRVEVPPDPSRGGGWRNLSPEQREAIRRLSREEREALSNRGAGRRGGAPPPGMRLSPQERRQLRDQIREEHERRGAGGGWGRRP